MSNKKTINGPKLGLHYSKASVSENNQEFSLIFRLSKPAPKEGLRVVFSDIDSDKAFGDLTFGPKLTNASNYESLNPVGNELARSTITIAPGAKTASVIWKTVPDGILEGLETTLTTLQPGKGYRIDPNHQTDKLTIRDTSVNKTPVVSVSATPRNVDEGSQLRWNFNLTEPAPTGGLIVEFALTQDTDPLPGDIQYNVAGSKNITSFELLRNSTGVITGAKVGIATGATSATLLNNIVADSLTEGPEKITYTLINGTGYAVNSKKNAAKFTIEDTSTTPVVSVSATPKKVDEGSQLRWNFNLTEPAPKDGLIVEFALTEDTDPLPGDIQYNVAGSKNITSFELLRNSAGVITGAKVGIAAGATSATLLNNIVADSLTEGPEKITYTLINGTGYAVNSKKNAAKFTIEDTSTTPVVSVSATPKKVDEGSQLRWNFNLTEPAPKDGLIVEFALTEDTDPLPGDIQYNVAGSKNITSFELLRNSAGVITGAKVGIAAGATSATLLNNIVADSLTEGPEKITYTLINGTGYAVNSKKNAAKFTIEDTSTTSSNLTTDELVSFELKDVLIPAQSGVANVIVNLDYKPGIDNTQFRDIIPVAKFVKDSLTNSQNPDEFYEIINKNVTTSLLNNRNFNLKSVLDEASIKLDVAPNANIPFAFSNTVTITPNGKTDELVSFELKDVLIPAQSGVANVIVNLDYKPGIDNTQFRDIIPVAKFVKDSLTNSQNPDEFYEIINKNVTTSLLNNRSFDLKSVLDEASIKLDVAPNANIPFAFSNTVTITPNGKTDELVSFELKDVLIPAQSGVANVIVNLDYKPGIDNTQFRDIIPVAKFVKDSLTNSQNPDEFYEIINKNVTTSLLNNRSFDLKSVLDEASIKLDVAPNANIPFAFSNTVTITPNGKTDELVSFELKDVLIPAQSGVANVSVDLDYKAGVDNTQFRDIIPVAKFVKDSLMNSKNPNDFYEVINRNVAEDTFSDLGLGSVLDSLTITLGVAPNSGIPFPFADTVTVTPNGITQSHGNNLLALNTVS